jgi:hypothetical protein
MTWTCEYCHRQVESRPIPKGWEFTWQSTICPECLARAKREHPDDWPRVVKGGEYANGKPDPRACKRCGACCRAFGIIEVKGMAQELIDELAEDYGLGYPTMEIRGDGTCICLKAGKAGNICSIYKDRPTICRILLPGSYWCRFARRRMGVERT